MADVTVSQLVPNVNLNGVQFLEKEGQILFSSEEVGRQLGYKNPAKSINILFSRNQRELYSYARGITVMSCDGKPRELRHFTEEGVYILSMLAETPYARDFRTRVARLLRQIREHREELARESGYQQGLSAARALPTAEADRKSAYLNGMKEGVRVQKRQDRLLRLEKILAYRDKGLTWQEIAKLTGCSKDAMRCALHKGRALFAKAMAVTA